MALRPLFLSINCKALWQIHPAAGRGLQAFFSLPHEGKPPAGIFDRVTVVEIRSRFMQFSQKRGSLMGRNCAQDQITRIFTKNSQGVLKWGSERADAAVSAKPVGEM